MADAYIKLFKKMLKWEWYHDINTFRLFMHCLLKANWQDTSWRGVELKRGQFVTSLSKLSEETGLSVHQIRGSLDALKLTGELTSKTTNKYRIITVNNWDKYQVGGKQSGKQTASKAATDKEYKEIKNKRNIYKVPAAKKFGGNTRKYSSEEFAELEQAALRGDKDG